MNIIETLSQITHRNGYAITPSQVVAKGTGAPREVIVHEDDTIEINATGETLKALRHEIGTLVPLARFADQQPPKIKESADATAETSTDDRSEG